MKIHFKSTRKDYGINEEKIIEFTSRLEIEDEEDDFKALIFTENRNGKIITNRIEYNENILRIYSGISSLQMKFNEVIKNNYVIDGYQQLSVFLYTKMINIDISNQNKLLFEYYICEDETFDKNTHIKLDLTIIED